MKYYKVYSIFTILFVLFIGCEEPNSLVKDTAITDDSTGYYDFKLGKGYVTKTEFSNDGSIIAICGRSIAGIPVDFVQVFEVKTGVELYNYSKDYTYGAVNFSDDGTKLLIRLGKDSAWVVNPRTGVIIQKFDNIDQVRLLSDGSAIITLTNLPEVKLSMYSVVNGSKIKDFTFNETGLEWQLAGTRDANKIILFNCQRNRNAARIIDWDIKSDTKSNEIAIPKSTNAFSSTGGSPNFSVVSIINEASNSINFYNTQTGTKINNTANPVEQYHYNTYGLADDLTYVVQQYDQNESQLPPTIYTVTEKKLQKTLVDIENRAEYYDFKFSPNCKYIAGSQSFDLDRPEHLMNVRVWKAK